MKALVEHIVRSIVDHPEDVQVEEAHEEKVHVIRLFVHPDDKGKVIGKQGRTAKAIRAVVHAAATGGQQRRVRLDIVE
ncbi:KH domain-containing protein [Shouchella lonarensis]|uniref:RNA-binding protein KhpA n=1 Tax=Shouchella lonarensis TaxID=1464122 RepID=A0A1G6LBG0_9BACI|nr:KH domain-containing protein [Shouchella lonarensis]SDC40498.1 RNA-binding protein (KH domain) [Shouchella lonarensis]